MPNSAPTTAKRNLRSAADQWCAALDSILFRARQCELNDVPVRQDIVEVAQTLVRVVAGLQTLVHAETTKPEMEPGPDRPFPADEVDPWRDITDALGEAADQASGVYARLVEYNRALAASMRPPSPAPASWEPPPPEFDQAALDAVTRRILK